MKFFGKLPVKIVHTREKNRKKRKKVLSRVTFVFTGKKINTGAGSKVDVREWGWGSLILNPLSTSYPFVVTESEK